MRSLTDFFPFIKLLQSVGLRLGSIKWTGSRFSQVRECEPIRERERLKGDDCVSLKVFLC